MGSRNIQDASLIKTKALPNGAATIYSDAFDLMNTARGDFVAPIEFTLTAPALVTADLPDTETMTYSIQLDDDVAFGSPTVYGVTALLQTGAGGAGDATDSLVFALPSTAPRYMRIKAVNSGAGDASDKSLTIEANF